MSDTKTCPVCGKPTPSQNKVCSTACSNKLRTCSPAERLWKKVEKTEHCWLWTGGTNNKGYGQMDVPMLRVRGRQRRRLSVHRISWELAYGPIQDGLCVLHTCDTPHCVRPEHLFLGTKGDNNQDCVRKGRNQHGENHYLAKLLVEDVQYIRDAVEAGTPQDALVMRFAVSQATISDVIQRRTWKSVS